MSDVFRFDGSYLDYYQQRLERASDGTRVPGLEVTAKLIERMAAMPYARVLDVGCSFGRLLPVLLPLSKEIFGIEMSYDVVNVAAQKEYRCVVRGRAEETNLPSGYFSHAILFGVFDCCDQAATLIELSRILRPGGLALLTGKNSDYCDDDHLALGAERNAWLKGFPNSFTHACDLKNVLPEFGLSLNELIAFRRRGDFGEMRVLREAADSDCQFYEYAAIVQATEKDLKVASGIDTAVSVRVSNTASRVARRAGFSGAEEWFGSDRFELAPS